MPIRQGLCGSNSVATATRCRYGRRFPRSPISGPCVGTSEIIGAKIATSVSQSALPNVLWDWYIMPEMCMDYVIYDFYNPSLNLTEGWAEFYSQSMLDLNAIKPNRGFLISPMFQFHTSYYPIGTLGDNFMRERWSFLFKKIQQNVAPTIAACASASTCPFALHLQDHVGLSGDTDNNFTKEVASEQFLRLKSVFPFKELSMNVEQFIHSAWRQVPVDTYQNPDCQEVREREQYYAGLGIPLGNAWCMGQWYSCNHPGSSGICPTGWTQFNEYCYRKYLTGKTWNDANNACKLEGAELASIHSKAENDFVAGLDRPAMDISIWVGLANPFIYTPNPNYVGTKDGSIEFRWTDGKPMDYRNWTPGWPTALTDANGEYKCGAMYTANGGGQWANAGCNWYAGAFVCKKRSWSIIGIRANANNKIVSAWNAGADVLQARSDWTYSWERFKVTANTDGTISLKSLINGKYICADMNAGGKLMANKDGIGTWERFKPIYNTDGTVSLIAQANGK